MAYVETLQGMWFGDPLADHLTGVEILPAILFAGIIISALTFRWERFLFQI